MRVVAGRTDVGHPGRKRALAAAALFALACLLSPQLRSLVGGGPVAGSGALSLASFALACVAVALVVRGAMARGRDRRGG